MGLPSIFDSEFRVAPLYIYSNTFLVQRMTGRTTLSVFYGINVKTHDDPYLAMSEEALSEFAQTFLSTAGLVVRF
jgi:hypothetical protein